MNIFYIVERVMFLVAILLLFFAGNYAANLMHEDQHVEVFNDYGIYDTEVHVKFFDLGGYVVAKDAKGQCTEDCQFQHNLIDFMGFQVNSILINMWLIFVAFLMYKGMFGK